MAGLEQTGGTEGTAIASTGTWAGGAVGWGGGGYIWGVKSPKRVEGREGQEEWSNPETCHIHVEGFAGGK